MEGCQEEIMNMTNRYYHYVCNDIEKDLYVVILCGLMDYQETIYFQKSIYINPTIIGKIFKMVLYDNPSIFFTSMQGYQIGWNSLFFFLKPKYYFQLGATIELQKWLNERVEEICSPILSIQDAFSKEIFIHNYLVENVRYSHTDVTQPINAYTVAGTLLENNSVCAGVALSFKLLMDYLDIPCIAATGMATNDVGVTDYHAWNLVYIDDSYYQVDVTWDLLDGHKDRVIKYDYFNLTSEEMYQSRIPDYEYPLCRNTSYNYFAYMNAVVTSPQELADCVLYRIHKGEKRIYFKYTFDLLNMKRNLPVYLKQVSSLGRYQYWTNEKMHTILIVRH